MLFEREIVVLLYVELWFSMFSNIFFNDTATTEIYTLSLHDALPILLFNKSMTRKPDLHTGFLP